MTEEPRAPTYSLKTLLIVVTAAAVLAGLYRAKGQPGLAFGIFAAIILFAFFKHEPRHRFAFCKMLAAAIIHPFMLPSGEGFYVEDVYITSVLFGVASWLLYSSIKTGHSSTRMFAIFISTLYVTFFVRIVHLTISNWAFFVDYWSGVLYSVDWIDK